MLGLGLKMKISLKGIVTVKVNSESKVICEKWKYWDGLSRYDSRPQV